MNNSKLDLLKGKVLRTTTSNGLRRAIASEKLVSKEETDAPASHPSEHNSILVIENQLAAKDRLERKAETIKRVEQVQRAALKGKGSEWDEIIAARHLGHQDAFQAIAPKTRSIAYLPYVCIGPSARPT